jgi:hypothetical protein
MLGAMNGRSISLLMSCMLVACQAPAPAPAALERVALRELPADAAVELGTDAVPLRHFELVVGERTRQLPAALDARLQGQTAVVWLVDHQLARFGVEGAPRLLARGVGSPPWASADVVVYALEVGDAVDLRMRRQEQETTLASGLASAGAFRLSPDGEHVLFVGAIGGGVAGLWVASLDGAGARCLTNCELRTGQPWDDAFVAPPGSAAILEFDGSNVHYVGEEGQLVTRNFR